MQNMFYNTLLACLVFGLIGCNGEQPSSKITLNAQTLAYADFANNSSLLATTDYLGNNDLWDLATNKLIAKLTDSEQQKNKNFADNYSRILLSDNNKLVFASSGQRLEIWDNANGAVISNFATSGIITSFDVNASGSQALLGYNDHSVQLINTKNGNLIWKIKYGASIEKVALSADGLYGLVSLDNGASDLWQITKNQILHTFKTTNKPYLVLISPQNRYVLLAALLEPARIYDLHSGELIYELIEQRWLSPKLFKRNILQVAAAQFSEDLSTLITASAPGRVLVWELKTGKVARTLVLPRDLLSSEIMPTILATSENSEQKTIYALTATGIIYKWQNKS